MMVEDPSLSAEQATQHLFLLLEQGEDSLKRKKIKKKIPSSAFDQAALDDKRRPLVSLPRGLGPNHGWEAGCWVQAANFAASTVA